ncbi:hypothetical protein Rhopal_005806-T1 [Rhodotorula paludigena]|uniref:F-box domain-containing protein n=1 Tax=Rhodotorula paludigena TaxID=86838 RepID=A0AAV5GW09_9BASI|nr:hypothetical protein Rhopal_005806-T1 [Rhodotorula paludigena]
MATAIVCAPSSDFQTPSSGYSYTRHSRPNRGELTSFAWSLHLPLPRPTPPHKRRKVGPLSSFRLFDELPVELVERVLRNLDLEDLGRLGRVNRSFHTLLRNPYLYEEVVVPHLPRAHAQLVAFLPSILPGTRHLTLRSFPSTSLAALLPACSSRLTTLDLSFSGVTDLDLLSLAPPSFGDGNGRESPLFHLRELRLKGCRRLSSFLALTPYDAETALNPLASLEILDLSWSSLSSLPLPLSSRLPALKHLNLSTTPYLPLDHLASALRDLPSTLDELDLSHLGLGTRELKNLGFSAPDSSVDEYAPRWQDRRASPLRLVLSGNDSLTLASLASLKRHWAASHSSSAAGREIEVEHSPMLLESDEEDDVRRFVEMVAGVVARGPSATADLTR